MKIESKNLHFTLTMFATVFSLVGCIHYVPNDDRPATDVEVQQATRRFFRNPRESMRIDNPSFVELTMVARRSGSKVVEEVMRQGTARRTVFNSNDNPVWTIWGFLRVGIVSWRDAFEVGVELMKSEDPQLKEVAKDLVHFLFVLIDGGLQDSDVVAYLKSHPPDQNKELIELLVQSNPERSLRVMSDSALMPEDEGRNLQWAAHLIEEIVWRENNHFTGKLPSDKQPAIEQLRFLAERPEWWARYYAADILRRYKSLADAATDEKLKNDPDHLVREAMNPPPPPAIDAEQPEPPTPHFPVIGARQRQRT